MAWPPRHLRFPKIARFLDDNPHDVIALQELWRFPLRPKHLDAMIAPRMKSGLALKTRFPVIDVEHGSFRVGAAGMFDRAWSEKGWQRVALDVDGTRVDIVNTHLHAYPFKRDARLRVQQFDELLAVIDRAPGAAILLGDLNVYEKLDDDRHSLAQVFRAGFVDAAAPFDATPTYDFAGERERFDRILVRGLVPRAARVWLAPRLSDHRALSATLSLP